MQKRLMLLTTILALAALLLCLQLSFAAQNETYRSFANRQSQKIVSLYQTRKPICDRNGIPLTCAPEAFTIRTVSIGDKTAQYPEPIRIHSLAPHILGYLSEGHGVTGIEAAFDAKLLENSQTATASIPILGNGEPVPRAEIRLNLPKTSESGVNLTLDTALQRICMKTEPLIGKGAVVCMDAVSGEILAICSFPSFTDPAETLTAPDAPLYNRALAAYPVGSVIKPIHAATILAQGISPDMAYDCTGRITVGNTTFRCHNRTGHGILNLSGAIANSCNPYFVRFTRDIPAEELLATAASFGFGQQILLADGVRSASGTLPEHLTAGEKANFSFGQGKLTASPLQICAAYAAIANGGCYRTPTLLCDAPKPLPQQVASKKTASILKQALYETVNETADSLAKSEEISICGKTGTAQTGRYIEGQEQLIGWFAGWFDAGDKKIAITVMAEDAVSGNRSAAPAAKQIAEKWAAYSALDKK